MILELIREALRNLRRHKLRSLLTALGIVFGTASVISMISTGEGARRAILSQIEELGITNIIINSRKPPVEQDLSEADDEGWVQSYGLTFRDASLIEQTVPLVEKVLKVHDVKRYLWLKGRRLEAKIRGVPPEYFEELNLQPMRGRVLTPLDGAQRKRVCVVRARLLSEIHYLGDPLELEIRLGDEFFRVVGLLSDFEFQSPNRTVLGLDDRSLEVYVPFETVESRYGLINETWTAGAFEATRVELDQIVCPVRSEGDVLDAARAIQTLLAKFHDKRDYAVTVPLELLESRQQTQRVFNIVLPIIAGISLLVGGIGILNIMLASITERTREIGIRRALGANQLDITCQFLIETVTLSTLAGVLGVALGWAGVLVLTHFTGWVAVFTPGSIALALGISCATGILFGLYPARRAAAMDPIHALRHE